jgi:hypothetical protein
VVDGQPFVHSGSGIIGSVVGDYQLRGNLFLRLSAGQHSVRLEWHRHAHDGQKWHSLQKMHDKVASEAHDESLVSIFANAENRAPSIAVPPHLLSVVGHEDADLALAGIAVSDEDAGEL